MINDDRVEFKMPKKLLDKFDELVEKNYETRSAVIRRLINDYMKENGVVI